MCSNPASSVLVIKPSLSHAEDERRWMIGIGSCIWNDLFEMLICCGMDACVCADGLSGQCPLHLPVCASLFSFLWAFYFNEGSVQHSRMPRLERSVWLSAKLGLWSLSLADKLLTHFRIQVANHIPRGQITSEAVFGGQMCFLIEAVYKTTNRFHHHSRMLNIFHTVDAPVVFCLSVAVSLFDCIDHIICKYSKDTFVVRVKVLFAFSLLIYAEKFHFKLHWKVVHFTE